MHQSYEPQIDDTITARFTFLPERAGEFLDEGRLVTQLEFSDINELMEVVEGFRSALVDCNAIVNGQEVNLSEFPSEDAE